MQFDFHIGIDYSGSATPLQRTSALQVYMAGGVGHGQAEQSSRRLPEPQLQPSPASTSGRRRNWCRREIAYWLLELLRGDAVFIAGIDHGFSFPETYFERYQIKSHAEFLDDFCRHWPTDREDCSVDSVRQQATLVPRKGISLRTGTSREFRLTERWTSSAKSVFQFDVQGSVAKSTHAGLPWLQFLRRHAGKRLHLWPFDGWQIPKGKCCLAEIYPAIFKNRYERGERSADQQDAYAVARWLSDCDSRGILPGYLQPPLTAAERDRAALEGWILGVA